METNDKLLKDFFGANKQEIADNGFTNSVMRKLPETADRSWIVLIFAALGMTISIYLGIRFGLVEQLFLLFHHVSIYYLMGMVMGFPLLGTAGYYLSQDKRFQLI